MKPILFNTDMVRRLLNGEKTVTRRVVKPQPEKGAHSPYECCGGRFAFRIGDRACTNQYKPPYRPGDILYVQETWQHGFGGTYLYRASAGHDLFMTADGKLVSDIPWCPSIHMPREAARIFLRVTDVRVERLQDITEEQSEAEGVERQGVEVINAADVFEFKIPGTREVCTSARGAFSHLWNSTIKLADRSLYGWEANPYVWRIDFERCENPEGG